MLKEMLLNPLPIISIMSIEENYKIKIIKVNQIENLKIEIYNFINYHLSILEPELGVKLI